MKSILILILCFSSVLLSAQTKNTATEVINYREVDGKIVLQLAVNGVMADFALDLSGHNAVLPEYLEKLKIDPKVAGHFQYTEFKHKKISVSGSVQINTLSLGNSIFESDASAFILKDASYLKKIGVAGILGSSFFSKSALTIDSKHKKITISAPYRPSYMKLDHRTDVNLIAGNAIECPVLLNGENYSLLLDIWSEGTIILRKDDFQKLANKTDGIVNFFNGYSQELSTALSKHCNVLFVKSNMQGIEVIEDTVSQHSRLGNGILKNGIISIDYPRQKIYFQPFDLVKVDYGKDVVQEVQIKDGQLNPITREYFLEHIFDYRTGDNFKSKANKPIVIDFWASWCGPCMRLLPEMEKIAEKYSGQVLFMKVNADKEKELCSIFKIEALPTLFCIPEEGAPIVKAGATPEQIIEIIEKQLLQNK